MRLVSWSSRVYHTSQVGFVRNEHRVCLHDDDDKDENDEDDCGYKDEDDGAGDEDDEDESNGDVAVAPGNKKQKPERPEESDGTGETRFSSLQPSIITPNNIKYNYANERLP